MSPCKNILSPWKNILSPRKNISFPETTFCLLRRIFCLLRRIFCLPARIFCPSGRIFCLLERIFSFPETIICLLKRIFCLPGKHSVPLEECCVSLEIILVSLEEYSLWKLFWSPWKNILCLSCLAAKLDLIWVSLMWVSMRIQMHPSKWQNCLYFFAP